MKMDAQLCIVGAGAAGLWAAAIGARLGADTLVLEKTKRTGTKVLSSGGSRCNLTTSLDADDAARCFGKGHNFIRPALQNLSPQAVRARFEALGVATKLEPEFQKVFPVSDSALQVRNALEKEAKAAGARFEMGVHVTAIQAIQPSTHGPPIWRIDSTRGSFHCQKLLLCAGGKSYPATGTTGDAYPWLRDLGLKVVDPVPALVPLVSPAPWVHQLSGIAVDGELRIGKARRRRPVLFTHRGLSGPAAMDLSEHITQGQKREARLDFLPDHSWEELRDMLVEASARSGSPKLAALLPLARRVVEMLAQQSGLPEKNPSLNQIKKAARHQLIENLKGLRIPITGSLGFAKAEVTAGGLALKEVSRLTMEVKKTPGLYAFGEVLDLHGPIGGFNFQSAFSTAQLAAESACKSLETPV
jgi:predicted Rossmann fold flavoprotein